MQCLGYAYIPWQRYWRKYPPAEAHDKGTLFPELYSPYFPDRKPPVVPIPYLNRRQPMLRKKKR
ncbi:MAG: spore coat associated protein CotJA [Desulfotomaculum sp.]|nr:spore coat associated protein CotJA [Desulfotomaculum sp.]